MSKVEFEAHVCAVCRTPLDFLSEQDGTPIEWTHTMINTPADGHDVVPVPRREMTEVRDRCDYCGEFGVVCLFVLPERAGLVAVTPDDEMVQLTEDADGLWGACAECAAIVESGSAARLTGRVARFIEARYGRPAMREVLYRMYVEHLAQPRLRVDPPKESV